MEKIVSLCKRRGFIFQSSEIYGGLNGCWDYGPLGTELKRNLKDFWWRRMVLERDDAARTVDPPPLLKKELAKNKTARENWEKLPFTHQKEMVRSITDVKQEETRQRRFAKVMDVLTNGKKWTG